MLTYVMDYALKCKSIKCATRAVEFLQWFPWAFITNDLKLGGLKPQERILPGFWGLESKAQVSAGPAGGSPGASAAAAHSAPSTPAFSVPPCPLFVS